MWNKYDRARKWQLEQKEKRESEQAKQYGGEKLYEPTIADELEKGDLFALVFSAMITIIPIAAGLLLLIVVISFLFMRIL